MKRYVILTLLFAACSAPDGGSRSRGGGSTSDPRARATTHPLDKIGGGSQAGTSPQMFRAADGAEELAYEDSCVESHEGGNTVITCTYGDTTCVETYDGAGNLLSWDCGAYGSYLCTPEEAGFTCVYSDGAGFTCEESFDASWQLVSSTCGGGGSTFEECTTQADGNIECIYDDGEWACVYLYDAAYALLAADCAGDFGSVHCTGDAEVLTCDYAYDGFTACRESYAIDAAYGLLESTCDWDQDGELDCAHTDTGLSCQWSDELSVCWYAYDNFGFLRSLACESEAGIIACERMDETLECSEDWDGQPHCDTVYDLYWNYISGTCVGVDLICPDETEAWYASHDPVECAALDFDCIDPNQVAFDNACGCGCITVPVDPEPMP
jgi:hypothetical protein